MRKALEIIVGDGLGTFLVRPETTPVRQIEEFLVILIGGLSKTLGGSGKEWHVIMLNSREHIVE